METATATFSNCLRFPAAVRSSPPCSKVRGLVLVASTILQRQSYFKQCCLPLSTHFLKPVSRFAVGPSPATNGRRAAPITAVQTAEAAVRTSELDAVSQFSEIVPDTINFDDSEGFLATAATVTPGFLVSLSNQAGGKLKDAVDSALGADCKLEDNSMSCFLDKAMVNVGAILSRRVSGKVSNDIDARIAHDTQAILDKVHKLIRDYAELEVPQDKLLFRIPATLEGIEAVKQLESKGIQTQVNFVYSLAQAAAAADAGASVIQILVGRLRDHARANSQDVIPDPGVSLVKNAYNYVQKKGLKTKVMAAALRNKQDVFSLLGVDYLVVPGKVLGELQKSSADLDESSGFSRVLSPAGANVAQLEKVPALTQQSWSAAIGEAAEHLLAAGLKAEAEQSERAEEQFAKIWPPANM
ncbi:Transaldolase-like protein [Klebsormidium nitens]|uniref:Transaldolase-like protein n=1 Tax=Klebsormidium nitens TaxID=105231 RepID=A0A1Y1HN01_KLENI|nr:Transaldolase-like protein [Klebsormidium nitens]|eukprot:GAQ80015.1 Transaldolase-like protein [Klebsormidium nitens]